MPEPMAEVFLGVSLTFLVVAFVLCFNEGAILYAIADARAERAQRLAAWRQTLAREDDLAQQWLAYEKDPVKASTRPELRDPANPQMQRIVRAMLAARALRTAKPPRAVRCADQVKTTEYARAVAEFAAALATAEGPESPISPRGPHHRDRQRSHSRPRRASGDHERPLASPPRRGQRRPGLR